MLAVIGDVQRTAWIEAEFLHREVNDAEQVRLLADLAAQKPNAVVLLGDMAFQARNAEWARFDSLLWSVRGSDCLTASHAGCTSFFPTMGNHDYQGSRIAIAAQIEPRFPHFLAQTHYALDWGQVRLIVLDGNRDELCATPQEHRNRCERAWSEQLAWLRTELDALDRSERGLRGGILFVHQSPYTQSPWTANDQADVRAFARLLLASQRGLALISAHAHGFERYRFLRDAQDQRAPKHFVVSAGGGGPRPPARRRGALHDDSHLPWPRPFNYLLLKQNAQGIQVTLRAIDKGGAQVTERPQEHMTWQFAPSKRN